MRPKVSSHLFQDTRSLSGACTVALTQVAKVCARHHSHRKALSRLQGLADGTRGAAKSSMAVLQILGAAMRLCAYEQLLVGWAATADPVFQARFRAWLLGGGGTFPSGVVGLQPGPLKRVERVRAKKYDYVIRSPEVDDTVLGSDPDSSRYPADILCAAAEANCHAAGRVCDISRLSVECASEAALKDKILGSGGGREVGGLGAEDVDDCVALLRLVSIGVCDALEQADVLGIMHVYAHTCTSSKET